MESTDPSTVVRALFSALAARDLAGSAAVLAPELDTHQPGLAPGRAPYLRMLEEYFAGFPDLTTRVDRLVCEDAVVAVRTSSTGTHLGTFLGHPPTGRRFTADAMEMLRVSGGLVRERWGVFDTYAMLMQLRLVATAAGHVG